MRLEWTYSSDTQVSTTQSCSYVCFIFHTAYIHYNTCAILDGHCLYIISLPTSTSQVLVDLPAKSEVILYTGLSTVQKKYYQAILMKDLGEEEDRHRTPCTHLSLYSLQLV